ncbi:hypothetical protein [Sphingomonas sp.]|jgi:hypothetical protein|uniref:hypothetical protein n=1 Tax=Sphingomonas sp. TaxID=28214 RepID=UPI002EDA5E25
MTDDLIRAPEAQPSDQELIRSRQKSRARLMALLLGAFVILVFAISIVKIKLGHPG